MAKRKTKIIKAKQEPSEYLLNLIDDANNAIRTAQTTMENKIMAVYTQARSEGYDYKGARKLIRDTIVNVSEKYVTNLIPIEDKREYSSRDIKRSQEDTNKPLHVTDVTYETINTTSTPETEQVGLTQEDVDDINKHEDEEGNNDQTISTETPTIQEKIEKQTIENIQLEQQLTESQIQIDNLNTELWRRKVKIEELELELEQTKNKLDEAREKIKELEAKLQDQDSKRFPFTLQPKDLHHECPKCHLANDIPITGRVYKDSWVVFVDNTEAQKQQTTKKWRNV